MNIDTLTVINERYKKIICELDDIILSITNEIVKNENIIIKNNKKKNCIFLDPTGYFICFSQLTKPYIKIEM